MTNAPHVATHRLHLKASLQSYSITRWDCILLRDAYWCRAHVVPGGIPAEPDIFEEFEFDLGGVGIGSVSISLITTNLCFGTKQGMYLIDIEGTLIEDIDGPPETWLYTPFERFAQLSMNLAPNPSYVPDPLGWYHGGNDLQVNQLPVYSGP